MPIPSHRTATTRYQV